MSSDFQNAFGAYTKEELEATLRAIDPEKNPGDYAAVKAALASALPAQENVSCLDVAALVKLEATIKPAGTSKKLAVIAAGTGTLSLIQRFFRHPTTDRTLYLVGAAVLTGVAAFVWIVATRKTVSTYRFSRGTMECVTAGESTWQQSLSDLVWVESVYGNRYEYPYLEFHWPTNSRRIELQVGDFKNLGVVND